MARQGFDLQLMRYEERVWACDGRHDRHGALADERDGLRVERPPRGTRSDEQAAMGEAAS
jgi:hypothetical protein